MGRRHLGLAVAALAFGAPPAVAQAPPGAVAARLEGGFQMTGTVTVARQVRGERVGQTFARSWTFASGCPAGACPVVGLVRQRAGGSDSLILTTVSPGVWSGQGLFYVPVRCGGRRYARGGQVPFTITVTVTGAAVGPDGQLDATTIAASYVNPRRIDRTPCPGALGHDAATYAGTLAAGG